MTAAELVAAWDRGDSIWSIAMGGIGPGYEQAIQVLAVEIVRDNIGKPLPTDGSGRREWGDATVTRIDYKLPNGRYACGGFSGAQVGAAKNLAWYWLAEGPDAVQSDKEVESRRILVSNRWPMAPRKDVA